VCVCVCVLSSNCRPAKVFFIFGGCFWLWIFLLLLRCRCVLVRFYRHGTAGRAEPTGCVGGASWAGGASLRAKDKLSHLVLYSRRTCGFVFFVFLFVCVETKGNFFFPTPSWAMNAPRTSTD